MPRHPCHLGHPGRSLRVLRPSRASEGDDRRQPWLQRQIQRTHQTQRQPLRQAPAAAAAAEPPLDTNPEPNGATEITVPSTEHLNTRPCPSQTFGTLHETLATLTQQLPTTAHQRSRYTHPMILTTKAWIHCMNCHRSSYGYPDDTWAHHDRTYYVQQCPYCTKRQPQPSSHPSRSFPDSTPLPDCFLDTNNVPNPSTSPCSLKILPTHTMAGRPRWC